MANARKILMKTSVFPLETGSHSAVPGVLEEENFTKAAQTLNVITSSIGKLGGNSINTDISANQTNNWSSFVPNENMYWGLMSQNWEESGAWEGVEYGLTITTSQVQLSTDSADLKFLYVKNTGSNLVYISLDSNSTYPIFVSSGASTMFRGTSDLNRNEIYLKTTSGTSSVDYILAN